MRISGKIKFLIPLFVLVFMVSVLCTPFSADEQSGKITVLYELGNVSFNLYKVGEITENGAVLSDSFAQYKVNMHCDNSAYTLWSYINRDGIAPLKTSATGENGVVLFSGLERGVYLICGESTDINGAHYTVSPSLISVPCITNGEQEWNITANAKFERFGDEDTPVSISVVKVWQERPGMFICPSIEIQLIKNSDVFDTVTLNEENNWNHTWKNLDADAEWTLTENVPEDAPYTVSISKEGYVFTVTNIFDHEETTSPTSPTSPTAPTAPTVPATTPTTPTTPDTPFIPQTGQLNWPIPVFSTAGILFIAFGVLIGRKNNE